MKKGLAFWAGTATALIGSGAAYANGQPNLIPPLIVLGAVGVPIGIKEIHHEGILRKGMKEIKGYEVKGKRGNFMASILADKHNSKQKKQGPIRIDPNERSL